MLILEHILLTFAINKYLGKGHFVIFHRTFALNFNRILFTLSIVVDSIFDDILWCNNGNYLNRLAGNEDAHYILIAFREVEIYD